MLEKNSTTVFNFKIKEEIDMKINHELNKVNQEIINKFSLGLKLANHSDAFIAKYQHFLINYFIEMKKPLTSHTSNQIKKWIELHQSNLKVSTLLLHLEMLSIFYAFCVREGYIARSPIYKHFYINGHYSRLHQLVTQFCEEVKKTHIRYIQLSSKEIKKIKKCVEKLNSALKGKQ